MNLIIRSRNRRFLKMPKKRKNEKIDIFYNVFNDFYFFLERALNIMGKLKFGLILWSL